MQVIGSVEDEHCFSALNFIKNKNHHRLGENLELSMCMFAQKFWTLEDFPFQEAFSSYRDGSARYGVAEDQA